MVGFWGVADYICAVSSAALLYLCNESHLPSDVKWRGGPPANVLAHWPTRGLAESRFHRADFGAVGLGTKSQSGRWFTGGDRL